MNNNETVNMEDTSSVTYKVEQELGEKGNELSKNSFNNYVKFVVDLVRKTKVIRYTQVSEMLARIFKLKENEIRKIIFQGEYEYKYLISTDYLLIDYNLYVNLSEDVFLDNINLNVYGGKMPFPYESQLPKEEKELLSCLTVVANMSPYSENFSIVNAPFNIMFTVENVKGPDEEAKGCLYEIIYLNKENYKSKLLFIREGFRIKKEDQPFIKRWAIIEQGVDVSEIDYIGFTNILKVEDNRIFVVEERENPWEL